MERRSSITRIGAAVGIRPEALETYRQLHANPWPEVLAENSKAGRSNYSIFLLPQKNLLFSCYEYSGHDRAADAARMAQNPVMQEWWSRCRPAQIPLVDGTGDRRWTDLELIFHQD